MKPLSTTRSALPPPRHAAPLPDFVIDLSGDYSQYTVPKPVAEAVAHAAESTDLGRSSTGGGRYLRAAIVDKLQEINGLEVGEDSVVITSGGTAGLCLALGTLADAGERVLVPDPGWPGYAQLCASWGIEAVPYPAGLDAVPAYDEVAGLLDASTKAMVVGVPANPTGALLSDSQLAELVEFATAHDLYLVSDENYDMVRYVPGLAHGPARFDPDGRVIAIYSFAKTHALAGLRLGYCVASPRVATALNQVQDGQYGGASSLALAAGMAALAMDPSVFEYMLAFYSQQRETALVMLPPEVVARPPDGGFHLLVDVSASDLPNGAEFAAACREECHVVVAPGPNYGSRAAQAVRITFAIRERAFAEGVERLNWFLDKHGAG